MTDALHDQLEAQAARLDELQTALEVVLDAVARLDAGNPDADGVIDEPPTLDEWVDGWLVPTFAYTRELYGWADLPGACSHLDALHQAHRHAVGSRAHATDPVVWHTTHLPRTIAEIQTLRDRATNERGRARRTPTTPTSPATP